MRFPPEFLDEIKARIPVSEVVRGRVSLKKAGREWKGLSPFNKEKTPSFFVNDQKAMWFDFSSGKNGNIFDFLIQAEGLTFPEAVERLAAQAGLSLPKVTREDEAKAARQRTLYDVLDLAAKFFEDTLASSRGASARGYLASRGIKATTQLEFRMGYAPAERFALKEYLGGLGVPVADMIEAGLLIAGEDIPVPYDRFRNRVIIPIQDQRGRVVAFGGRTLSDDVQPKYLNSPETPLFHKSAIVFNFHRARQPAHEDGSVVVVEGYMDAIAIYQAGIKSVVATMGTAFTDEQISLLWRLAAEPIVCFDSDRAGIAAAYRSIDRMLPALKVGQTFRFAFIHGEKDPDELIREKGLGAFKQILTGSLPLWDVLWQREVYDKEERGKKFDSPDVQAALEHKLLGLIRTIKDATVHTAYFRTCRTHLANLFWQAVRRDTRVAERRLPKQKLQIPEDGHQKLLLGLLVHYPDIIDEKADEISKIDFNDRLEDFRAALFDLLIVHSEISVKLIYSRLKPVFYKVLEEIHGEGDDKTPSGHRLMELFPIIKADPPREFISECMYHFILILQMKKTEREIEELIHSDISDSDHEMTRLLEMIRDVQFQRECIVNEDARLAEEAMAIRRLWAPTVWKVAA